MSRAEREHAEYAPQDSAEMAQESIEYPDVPARPRWEEFKRLWLVQYRDEGMREQLIVLGVVLVVTLILVAIFE